jgi:hypothetical protein
LARKDIPGKGHFVASASKSAQSRRGRSSRRSRGALRD